MLWMYICKKSKLNTSNLDCPCSTLQDKGYKGVPQDEKKKKKGKKGKPDLDELKKEVEMVRERK